MEGSHIKAAPLHIFVYALKSELLSCFCPPVSQYSGYHQKNQTGQSDYKEVHRSCRKLYLGYRTKIVLHTEENHQEAYDTYYPLIPGEAHAAAPHP